MITLHLYKLIRASIFSSILLIAMPGPLQANSQPPTSMPAAAQEIENDSPKPLPEADVENFVRSLSVIKHFYINKVKDQALFNNAIQGMLSKLDPHSSFLDDEAMNNLKIATSGRFSGIGVEILPDPAGLKVITPLDGSPAKTAGIKAGDLIIQVDGKLINDISMQQAIKLIRGQRGSDVELTVLREKASKPLAIKVKRDDIRMSAVRSKMLAPNYAYVRIAVFQGAVKKQLNQAIAKIKKESNNKVNGLVLDLRNNPGGLLEASVTVTDTFLSPQHTTQHNGLVVYTQGRNPDAKMQLKAKPENQLPGVPIVVLINRGSASASEIVAGALQDYKRAIIMGERSFGKGSVQTVIPISKTAAVKLTTALYYTPAGRSIQALGIKPDINIPAFAMQENNVDNLIKIQENNLHSHLANDKTDTQQVTAANIKQQKLQQKKDLLLAQKDYALYRALMMLKGMHALQ